MKKSMIFTGGKEVSQNNNVTIAINLFIARIQEKFGKKIKGFDNKETIIKAVETRSSSPVRIVRNECFESNIKGLFPGGEGAGYAGGITSAACDGLKIAERIITA